MLPAIVCTFVRCCNSPVATARACSVTAQLLQCWNKADCNSFVTVVVSIYAVTVVSASSLLTAGISVMLCTSSIIVPCP